MMFDADPKSKAFLIKTSSIVDERVHESVDERIHEGADESFHESVHERVELRRGASTIASPLSAITRLRHH